MMEASSGPVRSASLGTTRVGITRTSIVGKQCIVEAKTTTQRLTTWDYGFDIDNSI